MATSNKKKSNQSPSVLADLLNEASNVENKVKENKISSYFSNSG